MDEIRLNRLLLRDFQAGTITLNATGKDLFIFGANESGKTRLVSAFTWLLFNKDALGRADFEIKNLDEKGESAHGLEHSVEAELAINSEIVTLKKLFQEKWQKKRGSTNKEFTGHTTNYFVNGVPIQEKDYLSRIADIAGDESHFRLLTSPTTFPQLHWQKQRQLLLDICGGISDSDVISSNEKLSSLPAILGKHTLDDHRKIVTARRSEINKEMDKIPVRIDEVRRGLPDVTGIDRKASEKDVQILETALNDAKLRLQGVNTGGSIADLTKRLSGLNADLRKMEDGHRAGSLSTLNRLNQGISELTAKVNASKRRIKDIDDELKQKELNVPRLEKERANKRERWIAIDSEEFKDTTPDVCAACGQPLPSDKVQSAKEKALAAFNERKAERLGQINEIGLDLKEKLDKLNKERDNLEAERTNLDAALPYIEKDLYGLEIDRDSLKQSSEDFSGVQGYADLLDEIEDIEAQIKDEREGKAQDVEKIKKEIDNLLSLHLGAKVQVDKFTAREQGEKRIEELKAEEKKLSAEYERLESELYLIEQFIKTKVSMLTDRINAKFEMVRFKLFNVLINGGIEDCCEITVNGIPFNAGLNNAARIQAGCDIIRTLQQHFEMRAPVFCDNRESVTDLPKMDCQLISLVVSPEDKTLRIERR